MLIVKTSFNSTDTTSQGLDSWNPPEIRCALSIVGKQKPTLAFFKETILRIHLDLRQPCEPFPGTLCTSYLFFLLDFSKNAWKTPDLKQFWFRNWIFYWRAYSWIFWALSLPFIFQYMNTDELVSHPWPYRGYVTRILLF